MQKPLLPLIVFNPKGRDPEQDFSGSIQPPSQYRTRAAHPPINFHAYAACQGGSFEISLKSLLKKLKLTSQSRIQPILVLLRRDLRYALKCVHALKTAGALIIVSFKETGSSQVAKRLSASGKNIVILQQILSTADGAIASTPWLVDFYQSLTPQKTNHIQFIPTPYPVNHATWDFSRPLASRRGIFIGTREFTIPPRQHLHAILQACKISERTGETPITVFNHDGRTGDHFLKPLGFSYHPDAPRKILDSKMAYEDYLKLVTQHKIIFQLDRSQVPGQVAGDALLCRMPCVGGDSAIEQIAFPDCTSAPINKASQLLTNPKLYQDTVEIALARAHTQLSFEAVSDQLDNYLQNCFCR